jgi:CYTH domain-containing protein
MFDIFVIGKNNPNYKKLKEKFPFLKKANSVEEAKSKTLTTMYWVVWDNIIVDNNFSFDFNVPKWDMIYTHVFKNKDTYDGICLFPKKKEFSKKEIEYRFFVDKKEIDLSISTPKPYDVFTVDSYDEYLYALENSTTEMFWMTSRKIKILDSFDTNFYFDQQNVYDRNENHAFLHKVNDKLTYDGIFLLSKHKPVSKKEIEHRFLIDRKEWDIIASTNRPYDVFVIDTFEEYLNALENSTTEMFWMVSKNIKIADNFIFDDIFFDDRDNVHLYDRHENHAFLHKVNDKLTYDGVFLLTKHKPLSKKEIDHRFLVDRKEWEIIASTNRPYDIFTVDSYDEYLYALENSTTEMFWVTSRNIEIDSNFKFDLFFDDRDDEQIYDRRENHAFVHRVNDKDYYNGVFLLPKKIPVSKKEIDNRFLINKKEWGIVASGPKVYDKFIVDTYEDYKLAVENSTTEMFWIIPKEVEVDPLFDFNLYFTHDDIFNRNMHHSFQHTFRDTLTFNGINLVSKNKTLSEKEILYRFLVEKKDYEIVASKLAPYDVVFISYQEPNAEENYQRLLKIRPDAKRVHGVKGIHNAHIKAAETSETNMFWVVDGDAVIEDSFKFNYEVPVWDQTTVHVWNSKNPINDLVYGYGGVKLLPKFLTASVNVNSTDMTTSISKSFKVINEVSNVSAFNVDEFSTWRSAFRECVKLASKSIERQLDEETQNRLDVWTSQGKERPFGEYAIKGAQSAVKFVRDYPDRLGNINDFEFLKSLFLKDIND